MPNKLTKAQADLLKEIVERYPLSVFCTDGYRPAAKLVALGYAFWLGNERLVASDAGRLALSDSKENGK